jgi:hypothetical protein
MLGVVLLRASLGATLALLGALGAIAAGTLTANASPSDEPPADTFAVVSAAATAGNPDQLTVVVDSPSTLAGLTAQFLTTGTDVFGQTLTFQSSETDPTDSTQTQTTWTANIPVGADGSGLPLGNYDVNLTGTWTDSSTPLYSLVCQPVQLRGDVLGHASGG